MGVRFRFDRHGIDRGQLLMQVFGLDPANTYSPFSPPSPAPIAPLTVL